MADIRINENEWECTLCRGQIIQESSHSRNIWIISEGRGPIRATDCRLRTNFGDNGYLIHRDCIFFAMLILMNARLGPKLDRLYHANCFLWPVPRIRREFYTARLATNVLEKNIQRFADTQWDLSSTFKHIQQLPAELRTRVFDYCRPSAVVDFAILLKNVSAMACMSPLNGHSKTLFIRKRGIECQMHGIYVGKVKSRSPKPFRALTVCYDDYGCTSVAYGDESETSNATWYQIIPTKWQRKLVVLYKVCHYKCSVELANVEKEDYVRHITSHKFFRNLYLSDAPNFDPLLPQHCFGLPLEGNLCLDEATRNPVRLRRSQITKAHRTITVACSGNSVVDLQIHSSLVSDLDIYHRVDGIGDPRMMTWLSAVLDEDELVIEVLVRSLWNVDHGLVLESSIMV